MTFDALLVNCRRYGSGLSGGLLKEVFYRSTMAKLKLSRIGASSSILWSSTPLLMVVESFCTDLTERISIQQHGHTGVVQ
jgi:hypothetical protein